MITQTLGTIIASLLVALALLAPTPRIRAWGMLGALTLTPLLLLWEVWDTAPVASLRERPLFALVGVVVGLLALAGLTALFLWKPWLLALCAAAALPFRIPVALGGTTANLLVPLYLVVGAGAIAWAIKRFRGEVSAGNGRLEQLLVIGIVIYALQSVYSLDPGKALQQVVFFYVPFALLFAVLRDLEWTPKLLLGCAGVVTTLALVFAGIGFWEYQARVLLFNPKIINSNQFQEYFRVNSLFFDPNIYGRFLAVVMLVLAGVLLWAKRWREVLITTAVLTVLWAGLVLTLSQSSFIALFAGLTVLAALRFNAKRVVGVVGGVAVIALLAVVMYPSALRLDLGSSGGVNKASSGRLNLVDGGLKLAANKPLIGYGSGSFSRAYRKHEANSRARAVSASHTTPITVAAEQGVVGLAFYLTFLVAAFARLFDRIKRRGFASVLTARAVVACAFVGLVVHTLIYAAFLEDPLTWALLAVGVALAPAAGGPVEQDEAVFDEAFAPSSKQAPAPA